MQSFKGISASEGIAIGKTFVYHTEAISYEQVYVEDKAAELERFRHSVEYSIKQIEILQQKTQIEVGSDAAEIFEAHKLILEDPSLISLIEEKINDGKNAETALMEGIDHFASKLSELEDVYLRERAVDIRDIGQRVLRILIGEEENSLASIDSPVIVVAQELTPSDTAQIRKEYVLGFCIATGGINSHTAILARMIGVPAIVGMGSQVLEIQNSEQMILDGITGVGIVNPSEDSLSAYSSRQKTWISSHEAAKKVAQLSAITKDGHQFEVVANIGDVESAKNALKCGAEGVGLLRTEFLFLDRDTMPDEEEQFHAYLDIAEVMDKHSVIIRTLDVGGDKPLPYLQMDHEANPFLGLRGLRISLLKPELFETQLRAILRASVGHNLKIMFPMVANLSEVIQAKKILKDVKKELTTKQIPFADSIEIGIMIEVPSAAIMSDLIAQEIDFFSIGTNDLTQYTLACDRTNSNIASIYDHLNPSVIRLIHSVIENGHKYGKRVGICGEMAGDLDAIPILVGLGLDEFSMSPAKIPEAKQLIRSLDYSTMRDLAENVMNLDSADKIRSLVHKAKKEFAL